MSADAYHITAPHPEGTGITKVMQYALDEAGLKGFEIDYINTHGTSTPLGDSGEIKAIQRVFGNHAYDLNISSTKSMTGHLLGAAGAIEAAAVCKAIQENVIPPTINYEEPDPDCDLDYVPNESRDAEVKLAMSNNSGFGGHNASLVFGKL